MVNVCERILTGEKTRAVSVLKSFHVHRTAK